MEVPKLEYINYGVGFCVTDKDKKWIQLNKNLKKYPKLYKQVLAHEIQHFNSPNKHLDFWLDLKEMFNPKKGWDLLKFSLKHPKALLSHSPFFYENRRWSVNWFMLLTNIASIALIIGALMVVI